MNKQYMKLQNEHKKLEKNHETLLDDFGKELKSNKIFMRRVKDDKGSISRIQNNIQKNVGVLSDK